MSLILSLQEGTYVNNICYQIVDLSTNYVGEDLFNRNKHCYIEDL